MQSATEGRIGLVGGISGFVVAEDPSLAARLKRSVAPALDQTHEKAAEVSAVAVRFWHPIGATLGIWSRTVRHALATCLLVLKLDEGRKVSRLFGLMALYWFAVPFFRRSTDGSLQRVDYRLKAALGLVAFATLVVAVPVSLGIFAEHLEPVALRGEQEVVVEATPNPIEMLQPVSGAIAKAPEPWKPVRRPVHVYHLESPDIDASDLVARVSMRGKTERRDVLSWHVRNERKGHLRPAVHLVVERFEGGAPTLPPLFADFARRAADEGAAIDRMGTAGAVESKFGALEAADVVLTSDQSSLQCLMFRRSESFGFVLTGWYCGTPQRAADRVSLGCFLDRLDLVGAGQDLDLKRYFAAAERNRNQSCIGARQSGRRQVWLDHEAPLPPLKLSSRTR